MAYNEFSLGGIVDISEALRQAEKIVDEAAVKADLRVVAFGKTLDVLLGSARGGDAGATSSDSGFAPPSQGDQEPLTSIARKLGVDVEAVSEVYEVRDGSFDIILGHSRFAEGMSTGARQLAVLVAAGRQAAGLDADGWTDGADIRAICKEFGKYDQANFSGTLTSMHDNFSLSGKGSARKFKLTRAGWEYAKKLIQELTA